MRVFPFTNHDSYILALLDKWDIRIHREKYNMGKTCFSFKLVNAHNVHIQTSIKLL